MTCRCCDLSLPQFFVCVVRQLAILILDHYVSWKCESCGGMSRNTRDEADGRVVEGSSSGHVVLRHNSNVWQCHFRILDCDPFFCLEMSLVPTSATAQPQSVAKYVPVHRRVHDAVSRRSISPALSDASAATLVATEPHSSSKSVFSPSRMPSHDLRSRIPSVFYHHTPAPGS